MLNPIYISGPHENTVKDNLVHFGSNEGKYEYI